MRACDHVSCACRTTRTLAEQGHMWLKQACILPQADEGKLILAGAAGDPVEGALFVFKNVSQEVGWLAVGLAGRGSLDKSYLPRQGTSP